VCQRHSAAGCRGLLGGRPQGACAHDPRRGAPGRHGLGRWECLAADARLGLEAKLALAAVEKRARGGGGEAAHGNRDLPRGARPHRLHD
jgi:hypothetical protein